MLRDYDPLNDEILNTFGEIAQTGAAPVFHPPGGDIALDAVLDENYGADSIGTVGIRVNGKSLMTPAALLDGTGIEARQKVTVRGKLYSIKGIGNDIDGMAVMPINEAAA
jgi:hypothetical protein